MDVLSCHACNKGPWVFLFCFFFVLFYIPIENFSLTWRKAAKCRLMPGAYDLCAQRDLYRATPAVTRGRGFCSLTHRQSPIAQGI